MYLTAAGADWIQLVVLVVLMVVMLYFMIYRPQKKQEKKDQELRSSLEIGDEVTTIGGIVGRCVAIKEDTFVLETGSERTRIRFRKTAISAVKKLVLPNADKKSADSKK